MPSYRRTRINEETFHAMCRALREVGDPWLNDPKVSVTGAEVTGDLRSAKIYYSVYGKSAEDVKETGRHFKNAAGFFRGYLARELNMRLTPELRFAYDNSAEHGEIIAKLIKENAEKDGHGEDVER
ncbi:MAG: 30S ribosome-binding factor RbfA [Clostridia bacterium]|nr:30S ribosome-binding factor RbfA [Clostridia bacterium]